MFEYNCLVGIKDKFYKLDKLSNSRTMFDRIISKVCQWDRSIDGNPIKSNILRHRSFFHSPSARRYYLQGKGQRVDKLCEKGRRYSIGICINNARERIGPACGLDSWG